MNITGFLFFSSRRKGSEDVSGSWHCRGGDNMYVRWLFFLPQCISFTHSATSVLHICQVDVQKVSVGSLCHDVASRAVCSHVEHVDSVMFFLSQKCSVVMTDCFFSWCIYFHICEQHSLGDTSCCVAGFSSKHIDISAVWVHGSLYSKLTADTVWMWMEMDVCLCLNLPCPLPCLMTIGWLAIVSPTPITRKGIKV